MAKTLEQLLSLSSIIANETKAGANTALRVGGLFSDIIYYLRDLDYADKEDIPSLEGYATEQWVLGKGYATTTDLDARIDALVNGAPQAYDTLKEIADVLAGNVNSISDILTALGNKADKATTLSGYGITDAYTIAQIDSIVNGLSGDISILEGYFTDGVANSAAKLSDNESYTAWGQTFFENGKPKSVSGALTDVTDITSSGTITTNKIVIGNGTIEWDETNKGFKVTGLYSTTYLSAKGANTNGGSTPSGGQYTRLDTWDGYTSAMDGWVLSAKLGKGLYDTQNSLISRVGALEGKATNVSFTQSLTSGTQIGSITIDGASKNIYAPTIPTSDINKGVTAYDWGNHANAGYAMASALGGYLPLSGGTMTGELTSKGVNISKGSFSFAYGIHIGHYSSWGDTIYPTIYSDSVDKYIMLFNPHIVRSSSTYMNGATIRLEGIDDKYWDITVGNDDADTFKVRRNNSEDVLSLSNRDAVLNRAITISHDGTYPLTINGSSKYAVIQLNARGSRRGDMGWLNDDRGNFVYLFNNTSLGSLAVNSSGAYFSSNPDNMNMYAIYHSGNTSTIKRDLGLGARAYDSTEYLPLSGGTIEAEFGGLSVKRNAAWASAIKFENSGGVLGYIGINDDYNPRIWDRNQNDVGIIIHSGNIGSQSVLSAQKLITSGGVDAVLVNSSGNVTIGASDLAGASDKVFIDGALKLKLSNSRYLNIGKASFSWSGSTAYNLIWSSDNSASSGDIYTMVAFPHVPYLEKGKRGYSGNTYGAIIRLEGDTSNSQIWDIGAATTELFSIKSVSDTQYLNINKNGNGAFCSNKILSAQAWKGAYAIGGDSYNKAVIGYCTSNTNGIVFGAHNAALTAWADVNVSGTNVYLRSGETIIGTINSSGMNISGLLNVSNAIYSATGIWSDGYVSAKGQNTSSDMRLKNVLNNVVLNVSDIANAPSVRFSWKNGGGVDVGSSAQYWLGVLPDAVKGRDELEMQYGNIALLSAIAIAKRSESHEERIKRLEKENMELKQRIVILEGGSYA